MVATASTGYFPAADSADSMTASAPSKIAVATSETSARVGTGEMIIDSSICVATTTGLPVARPMRVICFCTPGTFSSGISTPRSPRATISASARSMISDSRVHRLRLFDLGHHRGAAAGDFLRLRDILRPLDERQRHPVDAGIERGFEIGAVLLGQGGERNGRIRQADALAVGQFAGHLDARGHALGLGLRDREPHLAVVDQQRAPGRDRGENFRMRQISACGVAGRRIAVEHEARRRSPPSPSRRRRCRAAAWVPANRPGCRSAGRCPSRRRGSWRPVRACGPGWCGSY